MANQGNRRIGKKEELRFQQRLERTLQYLVYFYLRSDSRFRKRFLKLVDISDRPATFDMEHPVPLKDCGTYRADFAVLDGRRFKTIELKVFSGFTEQQLCALKEEKIDVLIALEKPAECITPKPKLIRWSELEKILPEGCDKAVEKFIYGECEEGKTLDSVKRILLGIRKKLTSEHRPELSINCPLLLNRLWWELGRKDGFSLAAGDYKIFESKKYRGYGYYYFNPYDFTKKKKGEVRFWVGFEAPPQRYKEEGPLYLSVWEYAKKKPKKRKFLDWENRKDKNRPTDTTFKNRMGIIGTRVAAWEISTPEDLQQHTEKVRRLIWKKRNRRQAK